MSYFCSFGHMYNSLFLNYENKVINEQSDYQIS